MHARRTRPDSRALDVVRGGAAALAVLATVKFLHILIEADFDIARAPMAFLVPILALLAGILLTGRRRTVGVAIIAVTSIGLLVVFVLAIGNRGLAQQNWADTLLVFAGVPLAVAVLAATPKAVKDR